MKHHVLFLFLAACSSSEDDVVTDASFDQTSAESSTKDATADVTKQDAAPDVIQQADVSEAGDAVADATDEDADVPDVVVADAPIDVVVVVDASVSCSTNGDCAISEFCDKGTGNCAGKGTCTVTPTICPFFISPVCGCDKQTYNNGCFANKGRTSVDYASTCE